MSLNTAINLNHTSPSLYDDLLHYFKYASSTYAPVCPRPNGNKLVMQIANPITDIVGFVARDEYRKEIIVAIRGSLSIVDFLMDTQIVLVPFVSPGVEVPHGTRVHSGFLIDWNSVALEINTIVGNQLVAHPDFDIVTTGHSLGGSLALLAAVTLQKRFQDSTVRTYSYGAPRTGNQVFAEFVNACFGNKAHRVVHTNDGVPTIIPTSLGYHHHGIEYWQKGEPVSCKTTVICNPDGEDQTCSASIPTRGVNPAHVTYFGIAVSTPFCF